MRAIIYGLIAASLPFIHNSLDDHNFKGKIGGSNVIYTPSILGDEIRVTDNRGHGVLYVLDTFVDECIKKCDIHGDDLSNCLYYSDHERDDSKAIFDTADTYVQNIRGRILTQKKLVEFKIDSPQ